MLGLILKTSAILNNMFRLIRSLLFSTHEWQREVHEFDGNRNLRVHLQPGEVKIIKL